MKMRYLVVCVVFVVLVFSEGVCGVGLTHQDTVIHFKPNLKASVDFGVINIQDGTALDLVLEGELAKYATLSAVDARGRVSVNFIFPAVIEKPGTHMVYLHAKEIPLESKGSIMSVTAVRSPVLVKVPYPGKYLEISLEVSGAKVGENIDFVIGAECLGVEDIVSAKASVVVYGPNGEEIARFVGGEKSILSTESVEFVVRGKLRKEGNYRAVAIVDYDGNIARDEKEFLVGALYIEVVGFTEKFKQNTISPFEIDVKSKWNDEVSGVYADILISDKDGVEVGNFKTPGVDVGPWGEGTLTGFWDTGNLSLGNYKVNITLHYAGKTTEEIGRVKIVEDLGGWISPFVIGYFLFALFVIFSYVYIRRRARRFAY